PGQTASLACSYSAGTGAVYFYWYRQLPNKTPQYILQHWSTGCTSSASFAQYGFSSTLDTSSKSTNLTLVKMAVCDRTAYYCTSIEWESGIIPLGSCSPCKRKP
uniref:Ig-like domain-containing protein n=1 Tax=Callorhinchus milii TaxID=7868 RepID=A0A4W3I5N9_CALMI